MLEHLESEGCGVVRLCWRISGPGAASSMRSPSFGALASGHLIGTERGPL